MENLDLELSFSNDFSSWGPTEITGWTARQVVENGFKTDLTELRQSFDSRVPAHYESPSSWLMSDDESRYSGGLDTLPEAYYTDAETAAFES